MAYHPAEISVASNVHNSRLYSLFSLLLYELKHSSHLFSLQCSRFSLFFSADLLGLWVYLSSWLLGIFIRILFGIYHLICVYALLPQKIYRNNINSGNKKCRRTRIEIVIILMRANSSESYEQICSYAGYSRFDFENCFVAFRITSRNMFHIIASLKKKHTAPNKAEYKSERKKLSHFFLHCA